jgi:hypothetical protein
MNTFLKAARGPEIDLTTRALISDYSTLNAQQKYRRAVTDTQAHKQQFSQRAQQIQELTQLNKTSSEQNKTLLNSLYQRKLMNLRHVGIAVLNKSCGHNSGTVHALREDLSQFFTHEDFSWLRYNVAIDVDYVDEEHLYVDFGDYYTKRHGGPGVAKISKNVLHMSDRDFASMLRSRIREIRTQQKAQTQRQVHKLEQRIAELQQQIAKLTQNQNTATQNQSTATEGAR